MNALLVFVVELALDKDAAFLEEGRPKELLDSRSHLVSVSEQSALGLDGF